jgi:serine phosphatase RsbU (regulator of sigma subunit)
MSEPPELLPDRLPAIDGVELAATHLPASPARCDWYDAIALSGGTRLGVAIADVAGRGEPAAALASRLRHGLRASAAGGDDPGHVVGHVNGLVTDVGTQMSTLMFVVFTPATGELRGANAGHPPALIRRTDGAIERWDAGRSLPLGVADQDALPEETVTLAPGDALLLFTDGLLERRGMSIDDGLADLEQAVPLFGSASVLRTAVLEAMLGQGEHDDDVAVIAMVDTAGG